ncbi:hypothetical protein [Methanobrevibacter sp. UBA417]|jgi:hypothetical protein|uniref:hypothetical protein n=1 Tax=Methanobrevibacter sp. UBA417 TaxID=1915487 RepID=UPI0039B92DF3
MQVTFAAPENEISIHNNTTTQITNIHPHHIPIEPNTKNNLINNTTYYVNDTREHLNSSLINKTPNNISPLILNKSPNNNSESIFAHNQSFQKSNFSNTIIDSLNDTHFKVNELTIINNHLMIHKEMKNPDKFNESKILGKQIELNNHINNHSHLPKIIDEKNRNSTNFTNKTSRDFKEDEDYD